MALPLRSQRQAEEEQKKKKPEPIKFRESFKEFFTSREEQLEPVVKILSATALMINLVWASILMFVR